MKYQSLPALRCSVVAILSLLTVDFAFAELKVYENFEGTAAGSLNARSLGRGFAGSWVSESSASIVGGNMSYSAGEISINGGNAFLRFASAGKNSVFSRKIDTSVLQGGGDVYISMLVRLPPSSVKADDKDYFMVALSDKADAVPSFGPLYSPFSQGEGNDQGLQEGDNVTVRVAFNRVELHDYKEDGKLIGSVHFILYKGDHYHLTVKTEDGDFIYVDTNDIWDNFDVVGISIDKRDIYISKRV